MLLNIVLNVHKVNRLLQKVFLQIASYKKLQFQPRLVYRNVIKSTLTRTVRLSVDLWRCLVRRSDERSIYQVRVIPCAHYACVCAKDWAGAGAIYAICAGTCGKLLTIGYALLQQSFQDYWFLFYWIWFLFICNFFDIVNTIWNRQIGILYMIYIFQLKKWHNNFVLQYTRCFKNMRLT